MTENYKISTYSGVNFIKFLTLGTYDTFSQVVDDLADGSCTGKRLWDLTAGVDMTSLEFQQIGRIIRIRLPEKAKAAVIVYDDLSFGSCRMIEVNRFDGITITRVFRSIEEGLTLLNRDD